MIQFKDIRAGHTVYLFDRKTKDYIEANLESMMGKLNDLVGKLS